MEDTTFCVTRGLESVIESGKMQWEKFQVAVATLTTPVQNASNFEEALRAAESVMSHADVWMMIPNQRLGYKRPDEMIQDYGDEGKKIVLDIIASIREGVYI